MDEQTYILIAKVLSGEGSDADRRELEAWLADNPQHRAEYEGMKALWSEADLLFATPAFDTNAAWDSVASRTVGLADPLAALPENGETARPKRRVIPMWLGGSLAAAAVLVLGFFMFTQFFGADTVTVIADAGNREVELPDHSRVTLRKGSSLRYATEFSGAERNVSLDGEAFFDVTKDPEHPFVIDAQSASVRVLGTSFDVKCSPQGATVSVATGKVRMSQKAGSKASVDLLPGDRGVLQQDGLRQEKQSAGNQADLYWSTGKLDFDQQPLKDVLATIAAATDTPLVLDPSLTAALQAEPVTLYAEHLSVAAMLNDIQLFMGGKLTYVPEGKGYRIRAGN